MSILSTISMVAKGVLFSVVWVLFLFVEAFKSEKYESRGVFSFDATGDIEGHFTGVARTEYSHPHAGKSFNIMLEVPDLPQDYVKRFSSRLEFEFEGVPATDLFHVNAWGEPRDSVLRPSVTALFRSNTEMSAWRGSSGELRLEAGSEGDPAMIGEFSVRLVTGYAPSPTRAAQFTGQFDTHAPGARSTNGFSRFARRVWRTPVVQVVVFVYRLIFAIVGLFVLLLVFTVHKAVTSLRRKRSSQ